MGFYINHFFPILVQSLYQFIISSMVIKRVSGRKSGRKNKSGNKKSERINKGPRMIYRDDFIRTGKKSALANQYVNDTLIKLGFSPLSGSELKYRPGRWNNNPNIKHSHNCYAYAMGKIRSGLSSKPQPGYFAHYPGLREEDYKCEVFYERMKKDNPTIEKVEFSKPCRKGSHKIYLALDTKQSDRDYHYYRHDNSGYWSGKAGRTDVTDIDASGEKIVNPNKADRNYKWYQYKQPCGFYCVNPNFSRAHSKSGN